MSDLQKNLNVCWDIEQPVGQLGGGIGNLAARYQGRLLGGGRP